MFFFAKLSRKGKNNIATWPKAVDKDPRTGKTAKPNFSNNNPEKAGANVRTNEWSVAATPSTSA